jgi:hypothetical protein
LLGIGRQTRVLKPANENKSLHEISNDNEVRAIKIATTKNLVAKSSLQCFHSVLNRWKKYHCHLPNVLYMGLKKSDRLSDIQLSHYYLTAAPLRLRLLLESEKVQIVRFLSHSGRTDPS